MEWDIIDWNLQERIRLPDLHGSDKFMPDDVILGFSRYGIMIFW